VSASCRGVLCALAKVCSIFGKQECIAGQHNSGNFQVHRPDAQAKATKPLEDYRCSFIERQDGNPSIVVEVLPQSTIGDDLLRH
jgi:hypothetical protein